MPRNFLCGFVIVLFVGLASAANAQAPPDTRWSAEVGLGWDNGISGNINSSAIGTLNNQTVAILKNKYEDVYGTGLHLRFGGGYMFKENTEARVTFSLQSLDADLTRMGDIGASNLYGQYDDYQSFGIDFGLRQYVQVSPLIRGYGEASIGLAFIDETDLQFAAPQANFTGIATDFYDKTSAITFGANVGAPVPRAASGRRIHANRASLRIGHVGGGRICGQRPRVHQRQKRALVTSLYRRREIPILIGHDTRRW